MRAFGRLLRACCACSCHAWRAGRRAYRELLRKQELQASRVEREEQQDLQRALELSRRQAEAERRQQEQQCAEQQLQAVCSSTTV
eukprot:COSAG01_NODE_46725_length_397_cov_1.204698_1_plen_84_part_10